MKVKLVPSFQTTSDAKTYVGNCGILNWQWFDGFQESDLIEYLFDNADDETSLDQLIADFLICNFVYPEDYDLNYKLNVKLLRTTIDLTQKAFAEKLDISERHVQRLESRECELSNTLKYAMLLHLIKYRQEITLSAPGINSTYQRAVLVADGRKRFITGKLYISSDDHQKYDYDIDLDKDDCKTVADFWELDEWHIDTFGGRDKTLSDRKVQSLHRFGLMKLNKWTESDEQSYYSYSS